MSSPRDVERARTYPRFTTSVRIQHALMAISFLVLTVTGLPQKYIYLDSHFLDDIVELLGGIESVRIQHRIAATVLMLVTVYHLMEVAYRVLVCRVRLSMMPRFQDAVDALRRVRYNLGRVPTPPRTDRFTWEEKVEYWSLLWGTVIMIGTGFMLWNPIATARFLPGQFIPAAQVVHGGEALLAILAVVVWHFYAVHVRQWNRSMFTGELSEREMVEEHPLDLGRIKAGTNDRAVDPRGLARRRRWFLPAAGVVTAALLAGIYWFVTFEQTAITTLPSP
jgi:cytochrome b subunit of formate dehydrogenase